VAVTDFGDILEAEENSAAQDAVEAQAAKLGESPGIETDGDTAILTADKRADYQSIAGAFFARNMDPAEWVVERVVTNDWDVTAFPRAKNGEPIRATNHQLKLFLRRASSYLRPARVGGPVYRAQKLLPPAAKPYLAITVGDHHIPRHQQHLHDCACQWIRKNKPARGIIIGDAIDAPTVSRYDPDPANDTPLQAGINGLYQVARDYREACRSTAWEVLWGNHDDPVGDGRPSKYIRNKAPGLWGVQRANGGPSAFSLHWLCRLDELGFKEVAHPLGGYPHASTTVGDFLVCHGWFTGGQAGAAVLKTVQRLNQSVLMGHVHTQAAVYETVGRGDTLEVRGGVENGCMADIEQITYAPQRNMQNGFTVLTVWPDGKVNPEPAIYRDGSLFWRDQRYG
jgi:hypothetical protein